MVAKFHAKPVCQIPLQCLRMCVGRCRHITCGVYILVRAGHTGLILGVFSTLIYKKTALHDAFWNGDILYTTAFVSLMVFALTMYFLACIIDPGYVPLRAKGKKRASEDEEDEGTCSDEDARMLTEEAGETPIKLRRCGYCGIQQPLRTRHCEDCGRCVRKYDHHCPWLEACVGERNHKFFWLFLSSTLALICWGIAIVWPCLVYHKHWNDWFNANGIFLFDIAVMIIGGFMVLLLFCCHSYVMLTGTTTWEMMSRDRITYLRNLDYDLNPFHEGYIRNMFSFLCKMRIRKWDHIYRRNIAKFIEDDDL